jgi:hypothetical protein
MNTLKFGNGEWYGKKDTILAYNDENSNFKPLPFSFDRASSATRVNKDGLIETVGSGEPRIDYKDDSKGALLLEPSRTNLFSNSNLFTSWSKEATVTLTANYGVSPDGTQNSTRMQMSSNDSIYVSTVSGLTASVYVKGVQGETIVLSNGSSIIHTLTGQWDRIECYDSGSVSSVFSINTYSGATARDIELFGAQREAGSYPTSYIPTQGATATRVAEVCNSAGNDQVINSTEGVLYAEISALANDLSFRLITLSDGTTNNRISFGYRSTSNAIYCEIRNANVTQAFLLGTLEDIKNLSKVAIKYKENDFALWINGIEAATDNSGITPLNLSRLNFDSGQQNGSFFYGNVKDVKLYNTALTDAELQALTTI